MATRGRRLWLKVDSSTGPVRVYITRDKPKDDDGNEVDATWDPMRHEILIWSGLSEHEAKSSLLHELDHKCWRTIPPETQRDILGDDVAGEKEELMVSHMEGPRYDLLNRNGWLRLPRPPKF